MQTIEDIRQAVEDMKLGHRWSEIAPLIRPAIRVTYDESLSAETLPIGASRIGGWPDLPSGMEWPTWFGSDIEPGGPMLFLAQINLADTAALNTENLLPKTGILYFFACVWVNSLTYYDEEPLWAVRYFDGDVSKLQANTPAPPFPKEVKTNGYWSPLGKESEYHYKPVALRFEKQLTLPQSWQELRTPSYLDTFMESDGEEEELYQKLEQRVSDSESIGHPLHRMLGWIGGDSNGAFISADPNMVLLLQLDSNWWGIESSSDFIWEFSGCSWFVIEPEALAQRDFSSVDLTWVSS